MTPTVHNDAHELRTTDIREGYLVEGSVAQAAQLHQVGQAEDPVLDHKAHQLGEGLQQALEEQDGGHGLKEQQDGGHGL